MDSPIIRIIDNPDGISDSRLITAEQAEQNLATTDFETDPRLTLEKNMTTSPFGIVEYDGMTQDVIYKPTLTQPAVPPISPDIEKLWAALDAANDRINELYTRIDNFNVRASHKL